MPSALALTLRDLSTANRALERIYERHRASARKANGGGASFCDCVICEASMATWRALMDVQRPGWHAYPYPDPGVAAAEAAAP